MQVNIQHNHDAFELAQAETVTAPASNMLITFMNALAQRDRERQSNENSGDNRLAIACEGRRALTDMRLINSNAPDIPNSKVNLCIANTVDIYRQTNGKGSQLIFCDLGLRALHDDDGNQQSISLYDDIIEK